MFSGANNGQRHATIRVAALAIVMMACTASLSAQTYDVPVASSATVTLQAGSTVTVCDPGGSDANYPNFCNGSLTLVSDAATVISLSGYYSIESGNDCLYVYDGLSSRDHLISTFSGTGTASITARSGAVTFIFFSNNATTQMGFALSGSVCDTAAGQVRNVTVGQLTPTSATLAWDDISGGTSWTVRYGTAPDALNNQKHISTNSATLTGLTQNTRYYYRIYTNGATTIHSDLCNVTMRQLRTPCSDSSAACIAYTDLVSCHCEARYGTYANPNLNSGIFNSGDSQSWRIAVITTDSTDPRTGNQLHTIPDGYSHSVRLGNWQAGGQAENVTYRYHVDTTVHDLLLLKYAAVLENPNHNDNEQPRFAFEILDSSGLAIDPTCYSAEFAASTTLGWNSYSTTSFNNMPTTILWKDWTTVGVDLTPLHGQDIYVRLSTYDCARQQHFGYAYFVLDCADKRIEFTECGTTVENTFTAPEGFSYRWHRADNPAVTIGTEQSLHVTQAGEYRCTLTYGTSPGSTCSFDLRATAVQRMPTALFTWQEAGFDSCHVVVQFHNQSVVSHDAEHQQLTEQPCESATWLFDDGTTSNDDHPQHTFDMGTHTVRLVATMGGGVCSDTTEHTLVIQSPCESSDTVVAAICDGGSYMLFDTMLTAGGIYQRDSGYLHRTLFLTVNPNLSTFLADTIVENSLPYPFAGTAITFDSMATSQSTPAAHLSSAFSRVLSTVDGCDSTVTLNLTVWLNQATSLDSAVCASLLPFDWQDTTISAAMLSQDGGGNMGQLTGTFIFNTLTTHGADSTITLVLTVQPTYSVYDTTSACQSGSDPYGFTQSGDYTINLLTNQGCDSTLHIDVTIHPVQHTYLSDTIVENSLPYPFAGTAITTDSLPNTHLASTPSATATFTRAFTTTHGCDSIVDLSLTVWFNRTAATDSTICASLLPFTWHNTTIGTEMLSPYTGRGYGVLTGTFQFTTLTLHGADSTITLTLTVLPTYDVDDTATICNGDTAAYGITQTGHYDIGLSTVQGCDSLLHLTVTVNPVYDLQYSDTVCSNRFPYTFADTTLTAASDSSAYSQADTPYIINVTRVFTTSGGCDSTTTLSLAVNPVARIYERAVVCDGVPFTWKDGNTYSYSTYEPSITYTDRNGCDSTHYLILDLNDSFKASMRISPGTATYDNATIRLQDLSKSSSREWHYGNATDTARTVAFTYPLSEDSLSVLLVARSNTGCIDSVHGTVTVDRAIIWPPNAFTPDQAINNRFYIPSNDLQSGEIYIYNRQGILITRFDAIGGSWDGTCKGQPCPQATYTWVMTYTTKSQPRTERKAKGTVTLLR